MRNSGNYRRRRKKSGLRKLWQNVKRRAADIFGKARNGAAAFLSNPKRRVIAFSAAGGLAIIIVVMVVLLSVGVFAGDTARAQKNADETETLKNESVDVVALPSATAAPIVTPAPTPTPTPDPTLKYGMENERVQALQERLMDLGYLDIDESTQYYGNATKYAVQLFQRQHGLEQDGIAGPKTLEMINSGEAKKYTLLEGMKGTDVDSFQRRLKELGYLNKVTGYYGTETIEAVKAFQERNGLSADGKAGEKTFSLIYSPEAKESATKVKEERRKANINTMIQVAEKQLGKKYILGNEGPNSFDCSGLVYYCLKQAGSNRGRYNAAGYSRVSDWTKITSIGDLQKGDLIFFYNNARSKVGHVGIYIGNGMMIDASSSNGKVVKRSCTTNYWKSHFVCGRRPW